MGDLFGMWFGGITIRVATPSLVEQHMDFGQDMTITLVSLRDMKQGI
jgi:hypothetical protein